MEITREQFMDLMGFNEGDDGMDYAEELHEAGESWWEIAKGIIASMNLLLLDEQ